MALKPPLHAEEINLLRFGVRMEPIYTWHAEIQIMAAELLSRAGMLPKSLQILEQGKHHMEKNVHCCDSMVQTKARRAPPKKFF